MTDLELAPQKLRLPRLFRPVISPEATVIFNEQAQRQYGRKIDPIKAGRLCLELLMLKELQVKPPLQRDAINRLNDNLLHMPPTFTQQIQLSDLVLSSARAKSAKNRAVLFAKFFPSESLVNERHFICEAVRDATGLNLDDPLVDATHGGTTEYGWLVTLAQTVPNGVHPLYRDEIVKNLRCSVPTSLLLGPGITD